METYRVDDVTLNVHKCNHCGKTATEAEAQAAIKNYLELMGQSTCCVCGKEIKIGSFEVEHGAISGDGVAWFAAPTDSRAPITIRIDRGTVSAAGSFHEQCARVGLPYLPEAFWKERERSMWPEIIPSVTK